jgi:hypothetical protein
MNMSLTVNTVIGFLIELSQQHSVNGIICLQNLNKNTTEDNYKSCWQTKHLTILSFFVSCVQRGNYTDYFLRKQNVVSINIQFYFALIDFRE